MKAIPLRPILNTTIINKSGGETSLWIPNPKKMANSTLDSEKSFDKI